MKRARARSGIGGLEKKLNAAVVEVRVFTQIVFAAPNVAPVEDDMEKYLERAERVGDCWIEMIEFELLLIQECDKPKCINPDHLIGGGPTDNMRDRQERGRTHKQVSPAEAKNILALRRAGSRYKQIAAKLGIKVKRVEYVCTKWLKGLNNCAGS